MSTTENVSNVRLVGAGAPAWRVSVSPDASQPEALAARELVKYVEMISGARLELVEELSLPEGARHVIRIDADEGRIDGFDLAIVPDGVTIHGHTPRGALYGAYQLLENMGCRWFYIGKLGEVVPRRSDIVLECGADRHGRTLSWNAAPIARSPRSVSGRWCWVILPTSTAWMNGSTF